MRYRILISHEIIGRSNEGHKPDRNITLLIKALDFSGQVPNVERADSVSCMVRSPEVRQPSNLSSSHGGFSGEEGSSMLHQGGGWEQSYNVRAPYVV